MYLEDLKSRLKKYESFSNYVYEIDNDIINFYNEWKSEHKQMFIEEVSKFIFEKYNIDILEIYPKLKDIGGYYYDIIDDLRKIKSINHDILFDLAKDIDKIYSNIYFINVYPYLNENNNWLDKKIQSLNIKLNILELRKNVFYNNGNVIYRIKVNLSLKLDDIYYNDVNNYIIDILNIKYNYVGKSLDEIINNVDKNRQYIIMNVIAKLLSQIQDDIDCFQFWKNEVRMAFK